MKGIIKITCILVIMAFSISANADGMPVKPTDIPTQANVTLAKASATSASTDDLTILRMNDTQRKHLSHFLKNNSCNCGCGMKVGRCLVDDPKCPVSPKLTRSAIQKIIAGTYNPKITNLTSVAPRDPGNLDIGLIGNWTLRTPAGSGVPVDSTLKIIFTKNGKISYGTGALIEGSINPTETNSVASGNWHIDGELLHILWNDGRKKHYKYQKSTNAGQRALMMVFDNDKRFFKLAN